MDYTLTPSADRTNLAPALALSMFMDVFGNGNGEYTMQDLGPHLTCTEAEAFADLLAAHGQHQAADALREGHIDEDDHGDLNHNTGEAFTDAELEAIGA